MGWEFAFALGLILVFYLLYINGLLIFSAKTAAIFAGYVRRNGNTQLRFAACRGQVKRVVRFPNPGVYNFFCSKMQRENAVLCGGDGYDFQERSLFDKRYE